MNQFDFEDPGMVDALRRELASWQGTPFFPRTARKGVGVDCIQFAIAVLQGVGVVGPVEWPRYSVKGGGPELVELIRTRILDETPLREVDLLPLMPGDVLLASSPLHLAIVGAEGEVWQALHPLGVQRGHLGEGALSRVDFVFRAHLLP